MKRQAVDGTYQSTGSNRLNRKHRAATRDPKPRSVLVDKDLIPLLLKGQKTQIRVAGVQQYEAGQIYAVRTERGSPKRCDVEALQVFVQRRRDITAAEAKAEGHHSIGYFLQHWASAQGKALADLDPEERVTVLVVRVWSDSPRLLTPSGRPRGSDLGYTDDPNMAMYGNADPGEGLTSLQLTTQNGWCAARHDLRERETLEESLLRVRRELQGLQSDLSRHPDRKVRSALRAMQHHLTSIQTRLSEARLDDIENSFDSHQQAEPPHQT